MADLDIFDAGEFTLFLGASGRRWRDTIILHEDCCSGRYFAGDVYPGIPCYSLAKTDS